MLRRPRRRIRAAHGHHPKIRIGVFVRGENLVLAVKRANLFGKKMRGERRRTVIGAIAMMSPWVAMRSCTALAERPSIRIVSRSRRQDRDFELPQKLDYGIARQRGFIEL